MTLAGLALLLPARAAPASGADGGADGTTDAAPAAAIAEADLVRAALEGPALRGALQASRARGEAAGTGPALLSNPELLARHEQEGGSAGITTDALGAGLRVDLGLASVAERGAARLAGQAALARTRADTLEAICEVRAGALDLWLAGAQAEATGAASTRLEALARDMERLAAAGEISGYDRDRVTLARLALAAEHDARRVEQARARAALAAWTGAEVPAVDLLPLAPPAPGDDPGAAALDTDPLVAAPLLAAPLLTALRAERDAAARSLAAARRAALPDLAVEGGARWDGDPRGGTRATGFELGAGLELPLFDRQRADIAAARARLAEAEALLARHQAERARRVAAAVEATRQLGPPTGSVDAEAVWAGARARYRQGEASIDDLLQAAADVAAAGAAQAEREALRRRAALDLSCATGAFPEPELQSLYEESAR